MQVRSLGWEDPWEEGMATHSSILAWRISWTKGAWWATVHSVAESDMTETTQQAWMKGRQARLKAERQLQMVFICESAFSVICPIDGGTVASLVLPIQGVTQRRTAKLPGSG